MTGAPGLWIPLTPHTRSGVWTTGAIARALPATDADGGRYATSLLIYGVTGDTSRVNEHPGGHAWAGVRGLVPIVWLVQPMPGCPARDTDL
jgi:hypothetical protein